MPAQTVCLTSEKGKKTLGHVLKRFREINGWSMDDLVEQIRQETGQSLSKSSISELERGNTEPKWNTLAILAATGYMKNPVTGRRLKTNELFEIACETFEPIHQLLT